MDVTLGGDDVAAGRGHLEEDGVEPGQEAQPGELRGGGRGGSVFWISIAEAQQGGPEPILSLPDVIVLGGEVSPALTVQDQSHRNILAVDLHLDDVAAPGQPDVLLPELNTEGGCGQVAVLVQHCDDVVAACREQTDYQSPVESSDLSRNCYPPGWGWAPPAPPAEPGCTLFSL